MYLGVLVADMSLTQQKWLRFIIPGVMLYGLLVIFCWTTKWCELAIPKTYEEISKLLAAILLGFIYAMSGLREISNGYYYKRVNINVKRTLIAPFIDQHPDLGRLTWANVRPIFYGFVDNDKSLEKQSEIIRWNGLLWTSVADLRACCIAGALLFSISIVCGYHVSKLGFDFGRAGYPLTGLLLLFLLSFRWSSQLTEQHRQLGREQCEHIILDKRNELLNKLQSALN